MKENPFVYEYWSKSRTGKMLINCPEITYEDLVFLLPNNVKKNHHIPLTRVPGPNKKKRKALKRKNILAFKLWRVLEEYIEEILPPAINTHMNQFVDIKTIPLGDKNLAIPLR